VRRGVGSAAHGRAVEEGQWQRDRGLLAHGAALLAQQGAEGRQHGQGREGAEAACVAAAPACGAAGRERKRQQRGVGSGLRRGRAAGTADGHRAAGQARERRQHRRRRERQRPGVAGGAGGARGRSSGGRGGRGGRGRAGAAAYEAVELRNAVQQLDVLAVEPPGARSKGAGGAARDPSGLSCSQANCTGGRGLQSCLAASPRPRFKTCGP
jgi:hypothetical protein